MEKERDISQFKFRAFVGFLAGFLVLLLLNKYWVKNENYILQTFFEAGISIFLLLALRRLLKKKQENN